MKKTSVLLWLSLWTLSGLFLSCSDNKKGADKDKAAAQDTASVLTTSLQEFPVLYAEFQALTNQFNSLPGKAIRKIVFRFHFDGGATNGQPTLQGYPAKNKGDFDPALPLLTLSKADTSLTLPYPLNLGNLEFTRDEYESLLGSNPKKYLVFIPVKSANFPNSVSYKTAWKDALPIKLNIQADVIGDELNPSPPKNSF